MDQEADLRDTLTDPTVSNASQSAAFKRYYGLHAGIRYRCTAGAQHRRGYGWRGRRRQQKRERSLPLKRPATPKNFLQRESTTSQSSNAIPLTTRTVAPVSVHPPCSPGAPTLARKPLSLFQRIEDTLQRYPMRPVSDPSLANSVCLF